MKCWEAAPEVQKARNTHPVPTENSQIQAQAYNFVTHDDLASEDAGYDLEDWWNQMDVLTEQPTIHNVVVSPET